MSNSVHIGAVNIFSEYKHISLCISAVYQERFQVSYGNNCLSISCGGDIKTIVSSIKGFEEIDLIISSGYNPEIPQDLSLLFSNNYNVKKIKINNSCPIKAYYMLYNCTNLEILDLSGFDYKKLCHNVDDSTEVFNRYYQHYLYCLDRNNTNKISSNHRERFYLATSPKLKQVILAGWSKEDIDSFLKEDVGNIEPLRTIAKAKYNELVLKELTTTIDQQKQLIDQMTEKIDSNDKHIEEMKHDLEVKYADSCAQLKLKYDNVMLKANQDFNEVMAETKKDLEEKYKADLENARNEIKQEYEDKIFELECKLSDRKQIISNLKDSVQDMLDFDNSE